MFFLRKAGRGIISVGMPTLPELVGQRVLIRTLALDDSKAVPVKLVGVENGGVWIESQSKTNELLELSGRASLPKTPVFFLPFATIAWISSWAEVPAFAVKSFAAGK